MRRRAIALLILVLTIMPLVQAGELIKQALPQGKIMIRRQDDGRTRRLAIRNQGRSGRFWRSSMSVPTTPIRFALGQRG
jgi:hypothetical protein